MEGRASAGPSPSQTWRGWVSFLPVRSNPVRSNYGTRILNGDFAETAGSTALGSSRAHWRIAPLHTQPQIVYGPGGEISPPTRTESCRFRGIAVKDPRSVVG